MKELSEHIPRGELDQLLQRMGLKDLYEVPQSPENGFIESPVNGQKMMMNNSSSDSGNLLIETNDDLKCPPVPSRNLSGQFNSPLDVFKPNGGSSNNGKNDELLLNSDSDSDFDPRAFESDDSKTTNDFFGFEPTKTIGQQIFSATNSHNTFVNNMNAVNTSVSNGSNGFGVSDNNNNNGAVPAPLRKLQHRICKDHQIITWNFVFQWPLRQKPEEPAEAVHCSRPRRTIARSWTAKICLDPRHSTMRQSRLR